MILVTVGAQMPFPRLIEAMDVWAADHPDVDVLAQIGEDGTPPDHMRHVPLVGPDELRAILGRAEVVVGHAGMGTIIGCLELGTPMILMPRRGHLRETRNDHQMATAQRFGDKPGIWVAEDDVALVDLLDRRAELVASVPEPPATSHELIETIRGVVDA